MCVASEFTFIFNTIFLKKKTFYLIGILTLFDLVLIYLVDLVVMHFFEKFTITKNIMSNQKLGE